MSFFSPQVGFACDNVVQYELVLGNGTIITATAMQNADLFMALKGVSDIPFLDSCIF